MDEREHDGVSFCTMFAQFKALGRVKQHTVTHCSEKQENVPLCDCHRHVEKGSKSL